MTFNAFDLSATKTRLINNQEFRSAVVGRFFWYSNFRPSEKAKALRAWEEMDPVNKRAYEQFVISHCHESYPVAAERITAAVLEVDAADPRTQTPTVTVEQGGGLVAQLSISAEEWQALDRLAEAKKALPSLASDVSTLQAEVLAGATWRALKTVAPKTYARWRGENDAGNGSLTKRSPDGLKPQNS